MACLAMISLKIAVGGISNGCSMIKRASIVGYLNAGSRSSGHRVYSVYSDCGKNLLKFRRELSGDRSVRRLDRAQALSISSGEQPDSDGSEQMLSETESGKLSDTKERATVRLEKQEQYEVEGVEKTDIMIEEYRLEETGELKKVKVSVAGTSRSPTFAQNVSSTIKPHLQSLLDSVQHFSVKQFIRDFGKKKPGPEDIAFNPVVYDPKGGVSNLTQWTSTELTLQHAQMARIAKDTKYLVWAFGLFGVVRILEAIVVTFTARPFHITKLLDASNALDPLTVAFLANGMRKPMVAMLDVDPTNLQEVNRLKMKFWTELHAFYERQWKVMATLGIARLLNLIATHWPPAQFVTGKLKLVWDMMMALPLF